MAYFIVNVHATSRGLAPIAVEAEIDQGTDEVRINKAWDSSGATPSTPGLESMIEDAVRTEARSRRDKAREAVKAKNKHVVKSTQTDFDEVIIGRSV